jgi:hypothetical protein
VVSLARILGFAATQARYLALALPLFALFSTVQGGCKGVANGGYYTTTGVVVPDPPPQDCPTYSSPYDPCDDTGGYGP